MGGRTVWRAVGGRCVVGVIVEFVGVVMGAESAKTANRGL